MKEKKPYNIILQQKKYWQ